MARSLHACANFSGLWLLILLRVTRVCSMEVRKASTGSKNSKSLSGSGKRSFQLSTMLSSVLNKKGNSLHARTVIAELHNYRNRITCMHRNRNPCNSLLMVKMASVMDHGRVGPTTTTMTNDIAQHGGHPANTKSCSLVLQRISLILDIHMMLIDSCHIKRSADQ